jgi:hypothetical protein
MKRLLKHRKNMNEHYYELRDAKEIAKDYISGMSVYKICKKYDIGDNVVYDSLKRVYPEDPSMPKKLRQLNSKKNSKKLINFEEGNKSENPNISLKEQNLLKEIEEKNKLIKDLEKKVTVLEDFLGKF